MKFFFRGKIWDKDNKKVLASANEEGIFETEDKELQDKLISMSIDHDLSSANEPEKVEEPKPKTKSKAKKK